MTDLCPIRRVPRVGANQIGGEVVDPNLGERRERSSLPGAPCFADDLVTFGCVGDDYRRVGPSEVTAETSTDEIPRTLQAFRCVLLLPCFHTTFERVVE